MTRARACRLCPPGWSAPVGALGSGLGPAVAEKTSQVCAMFVNFFSGPRVRGTTFSGFGRKLSEELNPLVQLSNFSDPRGRGHGGANLEVVVRGVTQ